MFDLSGNQQKEINGDDTWSWCFLTKILYSTSDPNDRNPGSHLSHPIHADNCIMNVDGVGSCRKMPPAYTWRDYRYVTLFRGYVVSTRYLWAASSFFSTICGKNARTDNEYVRYASAKNVFIVSFMFIPTDFRAYCQDLQQKTDRQFIATLVLRLFCYNLTAC